MSGGKEISVPFGVFLGVEILFGALLQKALPQGWRRRKSRCGTGYQSMLILAGSLIYTKYRDRLT